MCIGQWDCGIYVSLSERPLCFSAILLSLLMIDLFDDK